MKTHLAVYEEGLFDLRGGKTFLRGANAPSRSPLKETLWHGYIFLPLQVNYSNHETLKAVIIKEK